MRYRPSPFQLLQWSLRVRWLELQIQNRRQEPEEEFCDRSCFLTSYELRVWNLFTVWTRDSIEPSRFWAARCASSRTAVAAGPGAACAGPGG